MQLFKKYRHGLWITAFGAVYLLLFLYLENRQVESLHIIHTWLDDLIPFCEYFVVPYLLWFPYMLLAILYFIFVNQDKQEYYRLTKNLCMGMSLFLLISFLYPNGHDLRPDTFLRDNIFVDMVNMIYEKDTATNILPSIHVFNSLAIHIALIRCQTLKPYHGLRIGSSILTVSIILSTMFLKQHSVIDVFFGAGLAILGYICFYREPAASRRTAYARHDLL